MEKYIYVRFTSLSMETEIVKELKEIKKELAFIKVHMIDRDEFMTPEEKKEHAQGMEEYRKGETLTLREFKKQMESVPAN